MSDNIKAKIRKLFDLARNNPNEHEAAAAMQKAQRLMIEHGISDVSDSNGPTVSDFGDFDTRWKKYCVRAACRLYGCLPIFDNRYLRYVISGRPDNIDAANVTTEFLVYQVELMYKGTLPKGLSKSQRAAFRRDFKDACARRLLVRAYEITEDETPIATSTGTALVVKSHIDQWQKEATDHFEHVTGTAVDTRPDRYNFKPSEGTIAGVIAGDAIDLQRPLAD
ncbi:MAG: DUF2786 domain-containing protein [Hyphomicrobiaceae bacterium]|nr:MAG: DUF2786 domain-containing protein [Hyphomicrobiaceae bacterium]